MSDAAVDDASRHGNRRLFQDKCCQWRNCHEQATFLCPAGVEPRLPEAQIDRSEMPWAYLCARHFEALVQRDWDV